MTSGSGTRLLAFPALQCAEAECFSFMLSVTQFFFLKIRINRV
jgi:hypothetical protein